LLDSAIRGVKMARQSGHTGSMALNPRPFSTRGSPSPSKNPKSDRLLGADTAGKLGAGTVFDVSLQVVPVIALIADYFQYEQMGMIPSKVAACCSLFSARIRTFLRTIAAIPKAART